MEGVEKFNFEIIGNRHRFFKFQEGFQNNKSNYFRTIILLSSIIHLEQQYIFLLFLFPKRGSFLTSIIQLKKII